MVTDIWVNIGSDDGLLFDGTKPVSESVLTYHLWGLWHSYEGTFIGYAHDIPDMSSQIIIKKLQPHLQGANGLKKHDSIEIWSLLQCTLHMVKRRKETALYGQSLNENFY